MKLQIANSWFGKLGQVLAILLVVALVVLWLAHRADAQAPVKADDAISPTASVARVTREDLFKQVTIPAEFRPYVEARLNAKVSGYVSQMNVDFGDKVKAGQLLATIEVPELQAQFLNAQAIEQKAEADYTNANLIYTRLSSVNEAHPNLVAKQDLDTAEANSRVAAAAIAAGRADVEKFRTLVNYTNITAPFDGVVTWRYADPGTLIQAGTASDSQSLPLVRVSDNYLLRLDFPVSVQYVQYLHTGDPVEVLVDSLGGRKFSGKITRSTGKVDEDTRTMMFEIEVPNAKLEVAPGMYATVVLKVENHPNALAVPIEAVMGKNNAVLVVNTKNEIESRQVTLGVEMPDKYEVLSGLNEGDLVVVGNARHLQPGQKVETKTVSGPPGEQ
ncbi:MAG: efflux RND transporter periplasmic adaptor subunit [Verrucomicrobiota bacterium]|jgi:RND family efflux transporter MFP subunit